MLRRDNLFIIYSQKNLVGLLKSYADYVNATGDNATSHTGDPITTSNSALPIVFWVQTHDLLLTVLTLTMHPLNVLCKEIHLRPWVKLHLLDGPFSVTTQLFRPCYSVSQDIVLQAVENIHRAERELTHAWLCSANFLLFYRFWCSNPENGITHNHS